MPKNLCYALSPDDDNDTQLVVTYSAHPFLVQVGDPQSGVSISASHLNQSGTYTFGEQLPGNAPWVVLQAEAGRE